MPFDNVKKKIMLYGRFCVVFDNAYALLLDKTGLTQQEAEEIHNDATSEMLDDEVVAAKIEDAFSTFAANILGIKESHVEIDLSKEVE